MDIKNFSAIHCGRRNGKKLDTYILLLEHLLFMTDNETIAIVSPNGVKTYNREELIGWLKNDYWR